MVKQIAKVQDADLKDKIVLIRVDHNVLKDGEIIDPARIDRTIGTLYNIVERGGRLILMSHIGRPRNNKEKKIIIDEKDSVEKVVNYLEHKLYTKFAIPEFVLELPIMNIHTSINLLIKKLKNREIGGIYLPNTRWFEHEENKNNNAHILGKQLAGLADIYVNDAFGSWQPHASTYHVAKYIPSYAGYLMQYELENLGIILNPERPFTAIIGGSKFDTKIKPLSSIIKKVDYLILGGAIYNTYLCAKYNIRIKGVDEEQIDIAKEFIDSIKDYSDKIVEIPYLIESDVFGREEGKFREVNINDLKEGDKLNYVLDVSASLVNFPKLREVILNSSTIFVNAVMGYSPYYLEGSIALYKLIHENKKAHKLYGGGDTNQEFKLNLPLLFRKAEVDNKYYFFTGGGTILKVLETGSIEGLEPIQVLIENKERVKRGEL